MERDKAMKAIWSARILIVISSIFFLGSCVGVDRMFVHKPKVYDLAMVEIGGVKQAIMIKGRSYDNPVLLFLHGGPGYPLFPFEPFEKSMRKLEKHFTIAYWEQRGTGKSYNSDIPVESMNVEQFVEDTRQVVDYLKERMGVQKVFIWGHSWGTNVGALYASRYPENIYAYIATGQSVNLMENERMAYEFVKENALRENNQRALRQLSKIDTTEAGYKLEYALTLRKWVFRYGGVVKSNDVERPYVDPEEISRILTASEYTIEDRLNLVRDPYFSVQSLWKDMKKIDLIEQAPEIKVPVYFLIGRHDIIVSHVLAEKYFNNLIAPRGKKLVWFEESAHRPQAEEVDKFVNVMLENVLVEAQKKPSTSEGSINY